MNRGIYQLMSARYNRPLVEENWTRLVSRGTTIMMAMVVSKEASTLQESTLYHCPEKRRSGTWERQAEPSWSEW